jgi:hypothetical protein
MIPRKPYTPKPMVWTPREVEVLETATRFQIKVFQNGRLRSCAETDSVGQCLAVMNALPAGYSIMVHAIGTCLGEEGIALVDREWLWNRLQEGRK